MFKNFLFVCRTCVDWIKRSLVLTFRKHYDTSLRGTRQHNWFLLFFSVKFVDWHFFRHHVVLVSRGVKETRVFFYFYVWRFNWGLVFDGRQDLNCCTVFFKDGIIAFCNGFNRVHFVITRRSVREQIEVQIFYRTFLNELRLVFFAVLLRFNFININNWSRTTSVDHGFNSVVVGLGVAPIRNLIRLGNWCKFLSEIPLWLAISWLLMLLVNLFTGVHVGSPHLTDLTVESKYDVVLL